MFPRTILWTALIALLFIEQRSFAADPTTVKVGAYDFPPFFEIESQGQPGGVTPSLLSALNKFQTQYRFELVQTTPKGRYQDFEAGRFDMIFFENPDWGWTARKLPIEASEEFLKGGEVYIAKAKPGRNQEFFQDLSGLKIAGILGYHYGYAGMKDDPVFLRQQKNMILVHTADEIIGLVLNGTADAGIVTLGYLQRHIHRIPDLKNQLLVSKRFDQIDSYRVITRQGSSPDAEAMSALMNNIHKTEVLHEVLREHGLKINSD